MWLLLRTEAFKPSSVQAHRAIQTPSIGWEGLSATVYEFTSHPASVVSSEVGKTKQSKTDTRKSPVPCLIRGSVALGNIWWQMITYGYFLNLYFFECHNYVSGFLLKRCLFRLYQKERTSFCHLSKRYHNLNWSPSANNEHWKTVHTVHSSGRQETAF